MSIMKVTSNSNPSKKMELNGSAVVFIPMLLAVLLSCDCAMAAAEGPAPEADSFPL